MTVLERRFLNWANSGGFYAFRLVMIELMAFFVTLLFAVVIVKSLFSENPIVYEGGSVVLEQRDHVALVMEQRVFVGKRDESVAFQRKVYKQSDPTQVFFLEGGIVHVPVDRFAVSYAFPVPSYLSGVWCSTLDYTWWPSWSQVEYDGFAGELCFTLPPMKGNIS